jgi:hypothetical protein
MRTPGRRELPQYPSRNENRLTQAERPTVKELGMTDFEELIALRELKTLVGEMIAANFAKGIGTISGYVAAKDRMIECYLKNFDGRTVADFQRHPKEIAGA